jgi:hypothetical protein
MRVLLGSTGLAALSAFATAIIVPPAAGMSSVATAPVSIVVMPAPVKHVTQYVQLKPGQTAPPRSVVQAAPAPTPRVVVITTTRQSGKP